MQTTTHDGTPPLAGDLLQTRARQAFWLGSVALLACLLLAPLIDGLWRHILPLEGANFLLAAFLFGAFVMLLPLGALCGLLAALFLRVESCFAPRQQPWRGDRAAIALGMLVTALPALAACYPPLQALLTGSIRYKFPATTLSRQLDPLAYWQGIGFWLMGAAALAWLAMLYWRARLRKG